MAAVYESYYPGEDIKAIRNNSQLGYLPYGFTLKCMEEGLPRGHINYTGFGPAWMRVGVYNRYGVFMRSFWSYKRFYDKVYKPQDFVEDQPLLEDDDV